MEFFLRTPDDKFILIDEVSRSHYLYEALEEDAPYEFITVLTPKIFTVAKARIKYDLRDLKGYKKWLKGVPLSDTDEINYKWDKIKEVSEQIRGLKLSMGKLAALEDMSEYNEIYVGIEIGNPTVDDIKM